MNSDDTGVFQALRDSLSENLNVTEVLCTCVILLHFSSIEKYPMIISTLCSQYHENAFSIRSTSNYARVYGIQWNPSKADTIGTSVFVRYSEVSVTQGFTCARA